MLRFVDPGGRMYQSFGTNNANVIALWGSVFSNASSFGTLAANGRFAGTCIRGITNGNSQLCYLTRNFPDNPATLGVAFAMRISILPQAGSSSTLIPLTFVDNGTLQCDLRMNTSGQVYVTRNGTSLGAGGPVIAANAWYHYELKITFHPTAGTVYLGINGVPALSLTGQNTRNSANSYANQVNVGLTSQNTFYNSLTCNLDFDDIVIYDGSATDANGLADIVGPIGDCSVNWSQPTAAGPTTQFTPSTGSNYSCVNEATPDGDTTYVYSNTVANIDLYTMATLPAATTVVKSLAVAHYARKDTAGARTFSAQLHTGGGTNFTATQANAPGPSYQYFLTGVGSNPQTSAAWAVSDVNALQSGQNLIS